MSQKLWEADSKTKTKSNLFEFEKFLATKFNYKSYKNYKKLFNWTIKNPKLFWSAIWEYANVKGIKNDSFEIKTRKTNEIINLSLNEIFNFINENMV